METKSVDKEFEDFLNTPLPQNKERVKVEDEIPEEETKEPTLITETTKKKIISRFINCLNSDPNNIAKIMSALKNLEGITEEEGQLYLKTLNQSNLNHVTDGAVTLVLNYLNQLFIHPERKDIKRAIMNDPRIRVTVNNQISDIFAELGDFAGALLFVIYAAQSFFDPYGREEEKSDPDKPDPTV